MAMASTLWAWWWEEDTLPPFVPPFLPRFRWGNDPDNPTAFDYFRWGDEATPKTGPEANAGDFNFGWR